MVMKSTPGVQARFLDRVRAFRGEVFSRMDRRDRRAAWRTCTLREVKRVAIILSASRSGSSLMFALLRRLPEFCALTGEEVPFYKLNGLSSDALPDDRIPEELWASERSRSGLARDLLSDCSVLGGEGPFEYHDWERRFADDLALRLPMQWPGVPFRYGKVRRAALAAVEAHMKAARGFRRDEFYLEFLARIRAEYPAVDPFYYDIPAETIRKRFPGLEPPSGPPNGILTVEEPPFILLEPARKVDEDDLADKILLLKSTVNCYRVDCIRALFPKADIRAVYLTRNPLASINGLYDGWLYRGFFSRNIRTLAQREGYPGKGLAIPGYSEGHEWSKWWWNFDLPPGWERFVDRPLQEVCAYQWVEANKAVQGALKELSIPFLRVRFEDVIWGVEARRRVMAEVCRFLWADPGSMANSALRQMPVVQATEPPDPSRWMRRKDILLPLFGDPELKELSEGLGYGYPGPSNAR